MEDDSSEARSIEAELERDRARLAESIDSLRSRLSASAIAEDAWCYLKDQIGPLTQSADHAIRRNPAAAVLIGVGVAWLLLGGRGRGRPQDGEALAGTKFEALTRWEDEGGNIAPIPEPSLSWVSDTDRLSAKAREALRKIEKDLRGKVIAQNEADEQRRSILAGVKRDSNLAFRRGLESLSAGAQDRIAAARETAYLASRKVAWKGARLIDERPFACGSIAFGIGAALGAVLPHTEAEDRVFGTERDRLMREAEDLLCQEKARAAEVLGDFVGTVRQELSSATASIVGAKS